MAELISEAVVNRITGGDAEHWLEPVREACEAWDINTEGRVQMFLAQTAHESAGYRRLVENLKYSAAGLQRTWPTRFDASLAAQMAYDEYAIAEHCYGGRYGNGPEGSGDGFNYRGRGLIQVTFHDNYVMMGEHLGADLAAEPELLEDPLWAAFASACFWDVNKCSEAADAGDFTRVTRIVSGSTASLDERLHWLEVIRGV